MNGAILSFMIGDGWADVIRYVYATLAALCSIGFAATLRIRWDDLRPGERILRAGLIAEHGAITYGAYVALSMNFPPTIVGLLLALSLLVVGLGFAVWIYDDLLPQYGYRTHRGVRRKT